MAVLVLAVLGIIAARRRNRKQTIEWINKQSKRKTKYIDVLNLSRTAHLDSKEIAFLWNLCKRYKPNNIEYLNRDNEAINELFKKEYDRLKDSNKNQLKIKTLFNIRYKLEKAYNKRLNISSTKALKPGQEFIYYDENKMPVVLKLFSSDKDYLKLLFPANLAESKPKTLTKITASFHTQLKSTYLVNFRVVRYETGSNNELFMITNHSPAMQMFQKRNSKRCDIESMCEFSAIKPVSSKKGLEMQIMEKRYKGLITDISPTGCRIICQYPIKKDQYLNIYLNIENVNSKEIAGVIVDSKHTKDGKSYALFIKFLDIPIDFNNEIYALAYGFLNNNAELDLDENKNLGEE